MSDETKELIKKLHHAYYNLDLESEQSCKMLHFACEDLFNAAEITESLASENPDKAAPSDLGWHK